MKIKLCVFACLALSYLSHAMQDNPNVVLTTTRGGLGRHYTIKPAQIPQIIIEQCAQCSNKAAQRCSGCQVVYYCSPSCQTAHWEAHKKSCQKFQSNIEYLRKAFSTFVDKALETGQQKYIEQAMIFHLQTLMRATQDKACAHDETISIDSIAYKDLQQFDTLVERSITNRETLTALRNQTMPTAFAKVRQLTTENKLVAPYGVRRYGMQAFLAAKRAPDEFIPEEEWQEKRLQALVPIEQKFKEENPSLVENE